MRDITTFTMRAASSTVRRGDLRSVAATAVLAVAMAVLPISDVLAATGPLGPGSEVGRLASSFAGYQPLGDGPSAPADDRVDGHVGGPHLANGLGALGVDFGTSVDEGDVVAAANRYDVAIGDSLDPVDVDVVAETVWRHVAWRMTMAGLTTVGQLESSDLARHGATLGIQVEGDTVTPTQAFEIVSRAGQHVRDSLRDAGLPEVGDEVTGADLVSAAVMYGAPLEGGRLRAEDTGRIIEQVSRWADHERSPRYARIGNVDLHLPGHRIEYAGLHQAASPSSLPQARYGPALVDILPSRNRGTHRSSAIDVQMRPSQQVVAPVSGEVVETSGYSLYGRYPDQRLTIASEQDPSIQVTVLHVDGLTVEVGDQVEAGTTPIAKKARLFPFSSQIDHISGQRLGHVHIEARRR